MAGHTIVIEQLRAFLSQALSLLNSWSRNRFLLLPPEASTVSKTTARCCLTGLSTRPLYLNKWNQRWTMQRRHRLVAQDSSCLIGSLSEMRGKVLQGSSREVPSRCTSSIVRKESQWQLFPRLSNRESRHKASGMRLSSRCRCLDERRTRVLDANTFRSPHSFVENHETSPFLQNFISLQSSLSARLQQSSIDSRLIQYLC